MPALETTVRPLECRAWDGIKLWRVFVRTEWGQTRAACLRVEFDETKLRKRPRIVISLDGRQLEPCCCLVSDADEIGTVRLLERRAGSAGLRSD